MKKPNQNQTEQNVDHIDLNARKERAALEEFLKPHIVNIREEVGQIFKSIWKEEKQMARKLLTGKQGLKLGSSSPDEEKPSMSEQERKEKAALEDFMKPRIRGFREELRLLFRTVCKQEKQVESSDMPESNNWDAQRAEEEQASPDEEQQARQEQAALEEFVKPYVVDICEEVRQIFRSIWKEDNGLTGKQGLKLGSSSPDEEKSSTEQERKEKAALEDFMKPRIRDFREELRLLFSTVCKQEKQVERIMPESTNWHAAEQKQASPDEEQPSTSEQVRNELAAYKEAMKAYKRVFRQHLEGLKENKERKHLEGLGYGARVHHEEPSPEIPSTSEQTRVELAAHEKAMKNQRGDFRGEARQLANTGLEEDERVRRNDIHSFTSPNQGRRGLEPVPDWRDRCRRRRRRHAVVGHRIDMPPSWHERPASNAEQEDFKHLMAQFRTAMDEFSENPPRRDENVSTRDAPEANSWKASHYFTAGCLGVVAGGCMYLAAKGLRCLFG